MNYGDTSIDNVSIDIHDSVVIAPVINVTLQLDGKQADEDKSDDLFDDDDEGVTGWDPSKPGIRSTDEATFVPIADVRLADAELKLARLIGTVQQLSDETAKLRKDNVQLRADLSAAHMRLDHLCANIGTHLGAAHGRIDGLRSLIVNDVAARCVVAIRAAYKPNAA